MNVPQLVAWAKKQKDLPREEKIKYISKYQPKIECYTDMIIARGEMVVNYTQKCQRYMEEMDEAVLRLHSYGVTIPPSTGFKPPVTEEAKVAHKQGNPLKP